MIVSNGSHLSEASKLPPAAIVAHILSFSNTKTICAAACSCKCFNGIINNDAYLTVKLNSASPNNGLSAKVDNFIRNARINSAWAVMLAGPPASVAVCSACVCLHLNAVNFVVPNEHNYLRTPLYLASYLAISPIYVAAMAATANVFTATARIINPEYANN
jgi:hypothetical protein